MTGRWIAARAQGVNAAVTGIRAWSAQSATRHDHQRPARHRRGDPWSVSDPSLRLAAATSVERTIGSRRIR